MIFLHNKNYGQVFLILCTILRLKAMPQGIRELRNLLWASWSSSLDFFFLEELGGKDIGLNPNTMYATWLLDDKTVNCEAKVIKSTEGDSRFHFSQQTPH